MTRADLLTKLARRTNKNTTLDTATQNRLIDFLNERNRRILSIPGTEYLRRWSFRFPSVSGSNRIAFAETSRVHRLYEATNDRYLEPMSYDDYRRLSPDPSASSGTPTHYVVYGFESTYAVRPVSDLAKGVYVSSSSAADTTQTVYAEGAISGNLPISASVTLNGTTNTQIGSISTWIRVSRWYLSASAVGTVTLQHGNAGVGDAVTIAEITPGQTEVRYTVVFLWPTPADAITYTADVSRDITNLAQNTDSPDLPEEWHDLVLLGALADEYQHMNDSRYEVARQEYKEREQQFRYWLATNGNQPMGTMAEPPSTLGAWYPAGT